MFGLSRDKDLTTRLTITVPAPAAPPPIPQSLPTIPAAEKGQLPPIDGRVQSVSDALAVLGQLRGAITEREAAFGAALKELRAQFEPELQSLGTMEAELAGRIETAVEPVGAAGVKKWALAGGKILFRYRPARIEVDDEETAIEQLRAAEAWMLLQQKYSIDKNEVKKLGVPDGVTALRVVTGEISIMFEC